MRILPLLLWAAVAVILLTQTSTARSLLDPLGSPQSVAAPGNILPAFVSPGTLGAFLTAVREATFSTSESRTAAEALSARFFDAEARNDIPERPEPATALANTNVHVPYIFAAALFEPALVKPDSASPKHTKKQRRVARRAQAQQPRARSFESAPRPVRHRPARDQLSKADLRWLNG
ncbi:MAG: hypothetical protein J0I81_10070 [Hyphomicrobium sp.]|nr:hypothetical protein [Hyphomicrobium sp.]